jgi:maltoporin
MQRRVQGSMDTESQMKYKATKDEKMARLFESAHANVARMHRDNLAVYYELLADIQAERAMEGIGQSCANGDPPGDRRE